MLNPLLRFLRPAKAPEEERPATSGQSVNPAVTPPQTPHQLGHQINPRQSHAPRRRPAKPHSEPQVGSQTSPAQAPPSAVTAQSLPRDHRFGLINVSRPVADALAQMGYSHPTPIQEQAIPRFLEGHDLVGQAMTGTGKTASFGIPLAELIDPTAKSVQAIVLVPTRELAVQVSGELSRIGKYRGLRVTPIYGGQSINVQINALTRGVHVVVGTPGRIMDHMGRGTLNLGRVKFAILDEADEMLDIGFADDMDRILRQTPRQRQTALFCATFPSFIRRLIHRHLRDPVSVRVGAEIETVEEVAQVYYEVARWDKEQGLREILDQQVKGGQALIFCRTQIGVDRLVRSLAQRKYQVYGLHGGKTQNERNAVMQAFREGSLRILVSTNLASRGIDIPSITHVINYDIPDNLEEYVHRIGRAGRMGREGKAITLISEWDFDMLDLLMEHMGELLHQDRLSVSP